MTEVNRADITDEYYREILDKETHHDHAIITDAQGTLRWKENPNVNLLVKKVNLNHLIFLLIELGYDKNSEVYRKLYRDMGYSLSGYWEVFYWDANNDAADKYRPPQPADQNISG